ncbi:PulJ/GspJ family protein [Aquipuribacter sp. SD81]|uniref:PulJ/GspJ family protein n=1 Tax=Aquipuribacter sp. SD81 TaxID=3127703 RepID=UPI003018993B
MRVLQSIRRRLRVHRGDGGVTLVELLVTMVIVGVVTTMITGVVVAASANARFNEDEARGLADVRKVVERLGRDVRQARSINPGATTDQLVLWIDGNSDFRKQNTEVVTWTLVPSTVNAGQFDVLRTVNGSPTFRQATSLVDRIAFTYSTAARADGTTTPMTTPVSTADAATIRLVTTEMRYDWLTNRGTEVRSVLFSTRLRNVG